MVDPTNFERSVPEMLKTPAMPFGDGRYYQPGGSFVFGTNYVDSKDQPMEHEVFVISAGDTEVGGHELREWLEAYHEGEDALVALEAERQQRRLDETGAAHAFKLSDVCAGGKKLEDCDTASTAVAKAEAWAEGNTEAKEGQGDRTHFLEWLGGTCAECSLRYEVAIKTVDGVAYETRFSNHRKPIGLPSSELKLNDPAVLDLDLTG